MNIHLKCPGCNKEIWILSTIHAKVCDNCNYDFVVIDDKKATPVHVALHVKPKMGVFRV